MSINSNNVSFVTTKSKNSALDVNSKQFELVSNNKTGVDIINLVQTMSCEIKTLRKEVNTLKLYLGTLINKTL
jgi:hypothetical protein